MVRLNKNFLTEAQYRDLFIQFARIVDSKNPAGAENVLREILGTEEQIMIAKRLAIIVLLIEGKSLYSISQNLKISPTTAERIKAQLELGQYEATLKRLSVSKDDYFALLKKIDSILHLGGILPHYNGPERYRGLGR